MIHIKDILNKFIDKTGKARFYYNNKDLFIRYFESEFAFVEKIKAGKFKEIEEIINEQTNFTMSIVENVINNLTKK
jgi:hypothetical protein